MFPHRNTRNGSNVRMNQGKPEKPENRKLGQQMIGCKRPVHVALSSDFYKVIRRLGGGTPAILPRLAGDVAEILTIVSMSPAPGM